MEKNFILYREPTNGAHWPMVQNLTNPDHLIGKSDEKEVTTAVAGHRSACYFDDALGMRTIRNLSVLPVYITVRMYHPLGS